MKNIFLYVVFILLIILPFNVLAYEFTCDNGQYKKGDNLYCRISGSEAKNYTLISGIVDFNKELLSCSVDSISPGLNNTSMTSDKFVLKGTNESNNLVTFKCSIVGDLNSSKEQLMIEHFSTQIDDGEIFEEILRSSYINIVQSPTTTKVVTNSKPRDTSDSNSLLTSITEKNLDFTNFSRFITEYNFQVLNDVSKLDFSYETLNPSATVEVKGKTDLIVGDNVIDLCVTTPEGETKTCYTINVKRLKKGEKIYVKESDADLIKLNIKTYNIDFKKDVFDYTIKLPTSINRIEVTAQPNVLDANVEISSTNNLVNGSVVIVKVISKDKSNTKEYKIHILKDKVKKDYSSYIYIVIFTILIIGIIVLIIRTMKKNREDPLLSAKFNKRKINKGIKTNQELVPEVNSDSDSIVNNSQENISNEQVNTNTQLQNNITIDNEQNMENINSSSETPIVTSEVQENNIFTSPNVVEQNDFNNNIQEQISPSVSSQDEVLETPSEVINTPIVEQSVQPVNVFENSTVNEEQLSPSDVNQTVLPQSSEIVSEIPILTNNEENLNDTINIQPISNINSSQSIQNIDANNISNELAASNQVTADMINTINSNNNQ